MDPRYENAEVKGVFSDEHKLGLWQKTELAVIEAMVSLGLTSQDILESIRGIWLSAPIDITWWKNRDREIHHDLNAFLDERLRHLPNKFHEFVHRKITSFDTEEPAFARMLLMCFEIVHKSYVGTAQALVNLAHKYRYTIMNARTHGQEAELQSFGARCLTWRKELGAAYNALQFAKLNLAYSKLSGAIGKYGGIDPELEEKALSILGFKAFYGATQIMPRIIYAPVAEALCGMVMVIDKIATDIRLNARSGKPLMREPFGKKQKGSSAMPHKRNPIRLEQLEGMARLARGYAGMILDNIKTWEERAIEQSCVERVAWPDLFHTTIHALGVIGTALSGLVVYPENMLREIHESRGTYASSEVKEFLKEKLGRRGLSYEDAYRIVQLACFNVFEPSTDWLNLRRTLAQSYRDASGLLEKISALSPDPVVSIRDFIPLGVLRVSDELDISSDRITAYNHLLKELFSDAKVTSAWQELFEQSFLLRHEKKLYREILGE